ncbi:FkbM family methyltransferase [Prochlorococcus sp. MIT 1341]|uniref:FkbM family methyltransferase n=1 Tax=Prochlorococcus sp. MIT 1341 TaxID=3096221 RepID=UPI002A757E45|nr:FkbM family methyltransferase [Prochlorococcus sp. MIT 1341]
MSFLSESVLGYIQNNSTRNAPVPLACISNTYLSIVIMSSGVYEVKELGLVESMLKQFDDLDLMIDIGANIGNHSIFLSKYFNTIIAFEPQPILVSLLEHNLKFCQEKDYQIFPIALGAKQSEAFISFNRFNPGGASLSEDSGTTKVQVEKLDDVLDSADLPAESKVSLIKIDVEGMEADVIRGATKTIEKYRPIVLFETDRRPTSTVNDDYLYEYLESNDYSFYVETTTEQQTMPVLKRFFLRAIRVFSKYYELKELKGLDSFYYSMVVAIPEERNF